MYKKFLFLILFLIVLFSFSFAKAADFATKQQVLQALSQIKAENNGTFSVWCHDFNLPIALGDSSPEVVNLQLALYKDGDSGAIFINGNFDTATYNAVVDFQQKYKSEVLTPAKLKYGTGKVGALTKAKLNKLYSCSQIARCVPSWTCSDWSNCSGSKQTRKCSDANVCKTNFGKPKESTACTIPTVKIYGNNTKGTVSVTSGDSVKISWEATNAIFCSASGNWSGGKNTKGLESTWPLTSSKIYNISCRDAAGTIANDTLKINVTNSSVNIKANGSDGPVKVEAGKEVSLNWTATGVKSCFASGDWSGDRNPTGKESAGYLSIPKQYTYALTCSSNSGNISDVVYVTVSGPSVNIKANNSEGPVFISSGKPVSLNWTTSGVVSCNAQGSWSGPKANSGSQSLGNVYTNSYYVLNCIDVNGNGIGDSVIVNIK